MSRAAMVAVLVLSLLGMLPAAAHAQGTGTIVVTSVTPEPPFGQSVNVRAKVSFTRECPAPPPGYTDADCGFHLTASASSPAACDKDNTMKWVGPEETMPAPVSGQQFDYDVTWTQFHHEGEGLRRACLYIDDTLIAETTFTHPPPTIPPPTVITDPPRHDVYDCSDFPYREDAQPFVRWGNPHNLDINPDGVACPQLPSRFDAAAAPDEPWLSASRAKRGYKQALSRRWSRKWRRGSSRQVTCRRVERDVFACAAVFRSKGKRYRTEGGARLTTRGLLVANAPRR